MKTPKAILTKNIKLFKGKYPDKHLTFNSSALGVIYDSMLEMAYEARREEDKEFWKQFRTYAPRLLFTRVKLWGKKFVRNQYVRQAQLRADTENYKCYVLQGKGLRFEIISTREFKYNKAVRIFEKDLTAKDMEKLSCFIAYPKRKQ